jgi:hypothetical protein
MPEQNTSGSAGLLREWRTAFNKAQACLEAEKLQLALSHAKVAARLAETLHHVGCLRATSRLLKTLSDPVESARLWVMARRAENPADIPEWDGTILDGTLVVVERGEHIGALIRWSRFVRLAAARARRCIVLAEPRLVPLFQRSFPAAEVRARRHEDEPAPAEADAVVGYRTLIQHFGPDDEAIRQTFSPLEADPLRVRSMRSSYSRQGRQTIGISWSSTSTVKQVPRLDEWAAFMRSFDATYVSLQYGPISNDLTLLREASGRELIYDESVDSLIDLDTFAAQVAAVDAVVSISGTCAHMSGAVNTRTAVIIDDHLRLAWPPVGETTPWYPATTVLRQQGRSWSAAFEEARRILSSPEREQHGVPHFLL